VRKLGILAIKLLPLPACHSRDPNKGEGLKGLGLRECHCASYQPISIKKSDGTTAQVGKSNILWALFVIGLELGLQIWVEFFFNEVQN